MRTLALPDVKKPSRGVDAQVFRSLLYLYRDVVEAHPGQEGASHRAIVVDVLVQEAIPIIGEALSSFRGVTDSDVQDEMVQVSAISISEVIDKGGLDAHGNFHAFLRQRCKWRMTTVLQKEGPQEFDFSQSNVPYSQMIATPPGQREVEHQLLLHQLRPIAVEYVRRKCRFTDQKRAACLFIAQELVLGAEIDMDALRQEFGLKSPTFYVSYTRVLLRDHLWGYYTRHHPIHEPEYWMGEDWVLDIFIDR